MDTSSPKHKIAIFASGAGTNAQKIIEYFKHNSTTSIALIVCNRAGAGVLNHAEENNIPYLLLEKEKFLHGNGYVDDLITAEINFIVLAGFLWKIPHTILEAFLGKIINIHPALLPKFGGKGMYGLKVHEAVIAAGETASGITIHYVDGQYDNGDIIFQATCVVDKNDTPQTLANKVHALEHQHFARVIEDFIKKSSAEARHS